MPVRLALTFLLFISAASLLPAQSGDSAFVVRNVRVFDGETIVERQTVVVSNGTIAAVGGSNVVVPPGTQEVAGEGRTLLPGLIDAHIHLPAFGSDQALQQNLVFGVTTTVVMWAAPPLVARIREFEAANRPDVASVLTAGTGATAPGGHPTQMDPQGRLIPTLSTPAEAEAFVAARIAEGSDFIKIIYDELGIPRKVPTRTHAGGSPSPTSETSVTHEAQSAPVSTALRTSSSEPPSRPTSARLPPDTESSSSRRCRSSIPCAGHRMARVSSRTPTS